MKKALIATLSVFIMTYLASCGLPVGFSPTPTHEHDFTLPIPTETPVVPTSTPEPTVTPTITLTVTPPVYSQIKTTVTVQILNMRAGPSSLFAVVQKLSQGSDIWIFGRARGDDWLMVRDEGNHVGWVSREFIQIDGSQSRLPIIAAPDELIIQGQVVDNQQTPIPGVNLAVTQGMSPNEIRTDVYSDAEGHFYAYLPSNAQGPWTVAIVGIRCTSPIMDTNCKYSGRFSTDAFTIMVPDDVEIPLIFEYAR